MGQGFSCCCQAFLGTSSACSSSRLGDLGPLVAPQNLEDILQGYGRLWLLLWWLLEAATLLLSRALHCAADVLYASFCTLAWGKVTCVPGTVMGSTQEDQSVPRRHLHLDKWVSYRKVNYTEQMQIGICTMYLLQQKHLRSFDGSNFVGSVSCLLPIKLDTAATVAQVASRSEGEKNNSISSL